jgi:hypothetical protein
MNGRNAGGTDGNFTRVLNNVAEKFSTVSGIKHWNHVWKQASYLTVQGRTLEIALDPGAAKPWELARLRSLGLSDKDLGKIAKEFEGQTKKLGENKQVLARFDEWSDTALAERFRQAMYAESFNNVVTGSATDKLAIGANPFGASMLQFRQHMVANQMRLVGRNVQLAQVDGSKSAGLYTGLFGLAAMGMLIDGAKQVTGNTTVTGDKIDDEGGFKKWQEEWAKRPAQRVYQGLDRSGIFGVLFEGSNMLEKATLPSLQGGLRATFKEDRSKAVKAANVDLLGMILGPTAGLAEGTVKGAGAIYQALGEGELSRGDVRNIRGLTPFNNALPLTPFINELHRRVGTMYDWPEPK